MGWIRNLLSTQEMKRTHTVVRAWLPGRAVKTNAFHGSYPPLSSSSVSWKTVEAQLTIGTTPVGASYNAASGHHRFQAFDFSRLTSSRTSRCITLLFLSFAGFFLPSNSKIGSHFVSMVKMADLEEVFLLSHIVINTHSKNRFLNLSGTLDRFLCVKSM